ncbi:hypothetical protein AAL_02091 [Moelleriella libera RCEF 2490]|uniref:Uncharacterized protein n=1 Tax=Moelleriella libera RCEF 2490 TaxID=1081109 RepID=A0A168F665_9HYPO|nr:hypothetical protein AAL_02091 [Moelleriella libera RCEF 2490]
MKFELAFVILPSLVGSALAAPVVDPAARNIEARANTHVEVARANTDALDAVSRIALPGGASAAEHDVEKRDPAKKKKGKKGKKKAN